MFEEGRTLPAHKEARLGTKKGRAVKAGWGGGCQGAGVETGVERAGVWAGTGCGECLAGQELR